MALGQSIEIPFFGIGLYDNPKIPLQGWESGSHLGGKTVEFQPIALVPQMQFGTRTGAQKRRRSEGHPLHFQMVFAGLGSCDIPRTQPREMPVARLRGGPVAASIKAL
jgi:hypothetical protein